MKHDFPLLKTSILSLTAFFLFASSAAALDPPPEVHNARWSGKNWATGHIDQKTINKDDIVKLQVAIIGGPPAGSYCGYSQWQKQGTGSVIVNFPAGGCFELVDYSPKGDSLHSVTAGASSVTWAALTPGPTPPHWVNDHCLCTTWGGGQWSDLTNCPADLWPSGHYGPGDSFTVTLKATCSRVDTAWSTANVASLSGNWGVGWSDTAQDYFKFGGSTSITLTADPTTLPAESTSQLTARVFETDSDVNMSGQVVDFSVAAGGGIILPVSAVTDANGVAIVTLGSGGISGSVTVRAAVPDANADAVVSFTDSEPGPVDPRNANGDQNVPFHGEPIHPGTGNLYFSQKLFGFPGLILPVQFDVAYNSKAKDRNGPLGFGWSHTFDVTLTASDVEVVIKWADGREDFFQDDGTETGTYKPVRSKTLVKLSKLTTGEYEAVLPNQTRYTFNTSGQLAKISDLNGNHIDLEYSIHLDRATDTAGRQIGFTYSGDRISTITTPIKTGSTVSFSYDGAGDLAAITDPRGNSWTFSYDGSHQILTQTDAKGNVFASNTYDNAGRVVQQVDALGGVYTLAYTEESKGMHSTLTSPAGDVVHHYYDKAMNIIKVLDGEGGENTAGYRSDGLMDGRIDKNGIGEYQNYDAGGNPVLIQDGSGARILSTFNEMNLPTKITDPLGGVTTFTYDDKGNVQKMIDPLKRTWKRTYDSRGLPLTITDPQAKTWTFTYNSEGLISTRTDPAGNATSYAYDAAGRMTRITLPGGDFSEMAYDAAGNLLTRMNPMGQITSFVYDANGNLTSTTFQPSGATTSYIHNAANKLTKIITPAGGEFSLAYNGYHQVIKTTDPDGISVEYSYDRLNRPVSVTRSGGAVTQLRYDAEGNPLSLTDPLGVKRTYSYDAVGRPVQISDPLGGTVSLAYDANGRLVSVTDELGHITQLAYDAAGQQTKSTAPDGGAYQFSYNANGSIAQFLDPLNHTWTFGYNDINLPKTITDPLGKNEVMTYDGRGRLTKRVLRTGEEITYAYDANGRLTSFVLPGPKTVSIAYSLEGNPTRITDASGAVAMAYDLEGRRTAFTDLNGKSMGFSYTPGGRLKTLTYPGNHVLQHAYDPSGRLRTLTDWHGKTTTFTYDAADRITRTDLPNGTATEYTYDSVGRLSRLRHLKADGTEFFNPSFTRNAAGQITSVEGSAFTAAAMGDRSDHHSYDAGNRLMDTDSDETITRYTFDAKGNLTVKKTGGTTAAYSYDILNRLLSVSDGAHITTHSYNGSGARISKTYDGVTSNYLNDGIATYCTYDASGIVQNYYVQVSGILLYSLDPSGNVSVYHGDERGNVVAVTDGAQSVVETTSYGPYGEEVTRTGNGANPFRFMGKLGVMTDESGLVFARARYFDPVAHRFLNEDPLGVLKEPNLYSYSGNDPVNYADPSGFSKNAGIQGNDSDYEYLQGLIKQYEAMGPKAKNKVEELKKLSTVLNHYDAYWQHREELTPGVTVSACMRTVPEIKDFLKHYKVELKEFEIINLGIGLKSYSEGPVGKDNRGNVIYAKHPNFQHYAAGLREKGVYGKTVVAVIDPTRVKPLWLVNEEQDWHHKEVHTWSYNNWKNERGKSFGNYVERWNGNAFKSEAVPEEMGGNDASYMVNGVPIDQVIEGLK